MSFSTALKHGEKQHLLSKHFKSFWTVASELSWEWGSRIPSAIKNYGETKQQPINLTIRSRRWKWIGHTLRKANNNITKQALEWNPQGKRKRGIPKNSWRRGVISELHAINTTWGEAKRKAQDRTKWIETVVALCPPWDEVE